MFKIINSDRRYSGFEQFKFIVSVRIRRSGSRQELAQSIRDYNEKRDWCIETWGNSCELPDWLALYSNCPEYSVNQHWSWQTEHGLTRIYLRTDKEANWFKLKYGN